MYVKVRVNADANKELFQKVEANQFVISVKEKPQDNLANQRVIYLISSHFEVPTEKVKIINGHHHSSKMLSVELPDEEIGER
jgi:uncharacterized protein YggU (UPF0235/DUF167 family)